MPFLFMYSTTCLGISCRTALASLYLISGASSSWWSWTGSSTQPGMYWLRSSRGRVRSKMTQL